MLIKTSSKQVSLDIFEYLSSKGWEIASNIRFNKQIDNKFSFLSVRPDEKYISWYSDGSKCKDDDSDYNAASINSLNEFKTTVLKEIPVTPENMKNYTTINQNGAVIEIKTFSAKDSTIVSNEMIKLGINLFSVYEGLPQGISHAAEVLKEVRNWKLGDVAIRNGLLKTYVLETYDYQNDGKVFYLGGLMDNPLKSFSNYFMTQEELNNYLKDYTFLGELSF